MISNMDDLIDSQDIIEAVEAGEADQALLAFAADGADYSDDWENGATLIRGSYFEEYAQELADGIGAVPADAAWPLTCIDWQQAARELQMDYTAVEYDGITYWVR